MVNPPQIRVSGHAGTRTQIFQNYDPMLTLTRGFFPGNVLGGSPDIIATCVFMPYKECVRFIPHVADISFPYGGLLQLNGAYDLKNGNTICYHDFTIEVTFPDYPGTRSASQNVPGLHRGDLSLLASQYCNTPGEQLLLSTSWPECSSCIYWDMDRVRTNLAMWLPGPPREGRTGFADEVFPRYFRSNRGSTADSTVSVSFPYGPAVWFHHTLIALPAEINTLVLLIHSPDHVNALGECLRIIGYCDQITELRLDFLPPVPWGPVLARSRGFLQRLCFHGIHDVVMVNSITQLMENNLDLTFVSFKGRADCINQLLRWIRVHGVTITAMALEVVGPRDDIDAILLSISFLRQGLRELSLSFSELPSHLRLWAAINLHSNTLHELAIVFPETESQDMHNCSPACAQFDFLPLRLPALEKLNLQCPPCSAFIISQVLRIRSVFHLKLRLKSNEFQLLLNNFRSPLLIQPSLINSLHVEGVLNMEQFAAATRHVWNNVERLTISGLSMFDIVNALRVPTAVTELVLIVNMMGLHGSTLADDPQSCCTGLLDHSFYHGHNDDPTIPPAGIHNLIGLTSLRLLFTRDNGLPWQTPSLGLCFGLRFLSHLPALETFEANEISRELLHYLAGRFGEGGFLYTASVFNGRA